MLRRLAASAACIVALGLGASGVAPVGAADSLQAFNPSLSADKQTLPAISGPRIVWLQDHNVGDSLMVRLYDTRTGGVSSVFVSSRGWNVLPPAIGGEWIVYAHDEASPGKKVTLYAYNVDTKARMTYGSIGSTEYSTYDDDPHFSVAGGRVTFADEYNGVKGVWVVNLATRQATKIANSGGCAAMSGDWVVWTPSRAEEEWVEDPETGLHEANPTLPIISARNLATDEQRTITAPEAVAGAHIDIDGTKITWDSQDKVYVGDLSDSSFRRIAEHGRAPEISGNTVVWADFRASVTADPYASTLTYDVYAYDLNTSAERLVAGGTANQDQVDVDNGHVVWHSAVDYDLSQIFCASLTNRPAPTCTFGPARTIWYGGSTTISGTLKAADGSIMAGARVRLQARRPSIDGYSGDPDYIHAGLTATTASDGTFCFTVKPKVITLYRTDVVTPFDSPRAPCTSATTKVSPKPKVVLVVPSSARRYHTVDIYCAVGVPAGIGAAGMPDLRGYYLENGKWVQRYQWYMGYAEWKYVPGRPAAYRSWAWSGDRSFVDNVRVLKPGRWRFRTKVSRPQWAPSYSAWKYMTVR